MVCIHNLTLGVTWAGSLLDTPLPITVHSKDVPKKKDFRISLGTKELDPINHINIYFGSYVCIYICMYVHLGIMAKHLDQKGRNLACALQQPG